MKLCLITPAKGVYLANEFDMHMALAHAVLLNTEYASSIRRLVERGDKIILDNSIWELGSPMSAQELYEACDRLGNKVYELILPDAFKSSEETIHETESFLKRVQGMHHAWDRNFVVPHGRDREDWLDCYDYFLKQDYAHTMGLPKILDDIWVPGGRLGCCLYLEQTGRVDATKQYHALGIRTDPIETLMLSRFRWIRSLDTALPVHAALAGVRFDRILGLSRRRTKRPPGFFDTPIDQLQENMENLDFNIWLMQCWVAGVDTTHPLWGDLVVQRIGSWGK